MVVLGLYFTFNSSNSFVIVIYPITYLIFKVNQNMNSLLFFQYIHIYRTLETLDIAYNYFGLEKSIRPILDLPRMKCLLLYGNPVLGPTGQDPHFLYIEDLAEIALSLPIEAATRDGFNLRPRAPVEVSITMYYEIATICFLI